LTNVSEKLQAAEESEFTDFDGSVVVGQRVHAALNGFKGKKVAILIATQGFIDKLAIDRENDSQPVQSDWVAADFATKGSTGKLLIDTANLGNHKIKVAYATAGTTTTEVNVGDTKIETDVPIVMRADTSSGVHKPLTFIQYNALLEPTDVTGNVAKGEPGGQTVIKYDNGTYIFDGAFRTEDGKVVFDLEFSNLSKTGMTELVPGAARFHANLLKDANGVILGVVFQQVGK